ENQVWEARKRPGLAVEVDLFGRETAATGKSLEVAVDLESIGIQPASAVEHRGPRPSRTKARERVRAGSESSGIGGHGRIADGEQVTGIERHRDPGLPGSERDPWTLARNDEQIGSNVPERPLDLTPLHEVAHR